MVYNRGKRSLPLDLTKPEAQEILSRLVQHIDVVLVNFRPDVAVKLGVDYEGCRPSIPGWSTASSPPTDEGARRPPPRRYDMIIQAMTGMIASRPKR